jgi:uncharacterized membrane protein YhaH (DUF805 family)
VEKLRPYFTLTGRTSRLDYWKATLLIAFAVAVIWVVDLFLVIVLPVAGVLLLLMLGPLVAAFCLAVRRLHDRNKSACWILLFYLLPMTLSALGELIQTPDNPGPGALLGLIGLPLSVWAFVEVGCRRGTHGPNKYGPDPLGGEVAEVFA